MSCMHVEVLTFNLRLRTLLTHSLAGSSQLSSKLAIREMRGKRGASCLDGAKGKLRQTPVLDIFQRFCENQEEFIQMPTTVNCIVFKTLSRPLKSCASAVLRGSKCNGSERERRASRVFPFSHANPQVGVGDDCRCRL